MTEATKTRFLPYRIIIVVLSARLIVIAFDLHSNDATLVDNFLNDVTFLANNFAF